MSDFSEFGAREREGWSDASIVDAYVEHIAPITDKVGKEIVRRGISPGDEVLDLCCGQGTLTAAMTQAGANVTGLDFSSWMIAMAEEAAPDARIMQGDATAMPFENESFNKVVCNFGMMHIPDQPRTLSEVRRVLTAGGQFIMTTWLGPPSSAAFSAVFGAMKAHADFSLAPAQPDLFAFADQARAGEMLSHANLEMEGHETLKMEWTLDEPSGLFEIFRTATVGAGMLIRSQTPEAIAAIDAQIRKTVSENYWNKDSYRVPVPVALLTARAI